MIVTDNAVVYRMTHVRTGHFYIGSTINFYDRKIHHIWALNNGSHSNKKLQSIWVEGDELLFALERVGMLADARKEEERQIQENRDNPLMVNFCISTDSPMKGLKFSDEHRQKISDTLKGREFDDDWRKKMSIAASSRKVSQETRDKQSARTRGIKPSDHTKAQRKIGLLAAVGVSVIVDGVEYDSLADASRALGNKPETIRRRATSDNPKFDSWYLMDKTKMEWPLQKGIVLNPEMDGQSHTNVYSKGRTLLGKRLTHFATYPIDHPRFGRFDNVEGFWWWLSTGGQHDDLRDMSGWKAKHIGKERVDAIKKDGGETFMPDFREEIEYANALKLLSHPHILRELLKSTLPLVHYYVYGKPDNPLVRAADRSLWTLQLFENVRHKGVAYLKDFMEKYHAKHGIDGEAILRLCPEEPQPLPEAV